MATSGGFSQSLLTSEDGFEQHCKEEERGPAKPSGVHVRKPLVLRRRVTQVWESAEPYPKPRALTMWYTFGSICLGLTMGAQGPVAISMAEQCGFVRVIGQVNGSDAQDTACGGSICLRHDSHDDLVSCSSSLPVQQVG